MKHEAPPSRAARVRMVQRFFPTRTLGNSQKALSGRAPLSPVRSRRPQSGFHERHYNHGRENGGVLLRGSHAPLPFPENGEEKDIMDLRLQDEGAATEEERKYMHQ